MEFLQNKWLMSADWHLHNYPHHNLDNDPNFRMNQFLRLADRTVEAMQEHGCHGCIIAGDLVQVPNVSPEVQHLLWETIKKLATHGPVLISLGNHDRSCKNDSLNIKQSIVPLLNDLPNVHFIDQEVITIAGKSVGFQAWLPEHKLDWYDGEIDVLINHYTAAGEAWGGQAIDNTRFGVMFYGDIHHHGKKGNLVSIGNPIGHRLGDEQDCKLLIADFNGQQGEHNCGGGVSFDWIDTIVPNKWDFLRMYRPDKKPKHAGEYKYDVEVPYPMKSGKVDESELVSGINVDEVVNAKVAYHALEHVHARVLASSAGHIKDPVDLRFKLCSIEIENYRSVEHFKMEMRGGVTLISGEPGAGKTTVIRAMEYALVGDRLIREQHRNTAQKGEDLRVDLVLQYKGQFVRVERGPGYNNLWVGDAQQVQVDSYAPSDSGHHYEKISSGGANESSAKIAEVLEFMKHWNLMYINQFSSGLFASMNQAARIEMLASILGWEAVQVYHRTAQSIVQDTRTEINAQVNSAEKLEAQCEIIEEMGLVHDDTDYEELEREVKTKITEEESKQATYKTRQSKQDEIDQKYNSGQYFRDLVEPTSTLDSLAGADSVAAESEVVRLQELAKTEAVVLGKYQDEITEVNNRGRERTKELNAQLSTMTEKVNELNGKSTKLAADLKLDGQKIESRRADIIRHESELKSAKESFDNFSNPTCTSCGQDLNDESKIEAARLAIQARIDKAQLNYDELVRQDSEATSAYKDLEATPDPAVAVPVIETQISVVRGQLDSINAEINSEVDVVKKQQREYADTVVAKTNAKLEAALSYKKDIGNYEKAMKALRDIDESVDKLRGEFAAWLADVKPMSDEEFGASQVAVNLHYEEIGKIRAQSSEAKRNNDQLVKVGQMRQGLAAQLADIEKLRNDIEPIESYIALTANEGSIVRSILETCAAMLSNDKLKVETTKELRGGEIRPDLNLSMLVGKKWIPYHNLSGGQLFTADIRFLLSMIEVSGGTGVLILDEAFKYFSSDHINEIAEEIEVCNADNVLVITHNNNYPQCHRVLHARLDDDGISHYALRDSE